MTSRVQQPADELGHYALLAHTCPFVATRIFVRRGEDVYHALPLPDDLPLLPQAPG